MPPSPASRSGAAPEWLVLAVRAAYANSLAGVFQFDDYNEIVVQQALSNAWLKAQGLVSIEDRWRQAQGGLTVELSGSRQQDARPGLAKMYRVPPARAWWPAVGAPLERWVSDELAK